MRLEHEDIIYLIFIIMAILLLKFLVRNPQVIPDTIPKKWASAKFALHLIMILTS